MRKIELGYLKETINGDEKNNGGKKMTKKTYTVSITYVGEIEAENEEELEESLYVVHTGIFGEPYDGFPLEAEQVEIEEVEE